jgi:hypothetical protein
MRTAATIGLGIVVAAFAVLNILFWMRVVTRWAEQFRRRCERRYGVVITIGFRGAWNVTGGGPWYRSLGIELLQLAYFMGAFVVWIIGMLCVVAVMSLLASAS